MEGVDSQGHPAFFEKQITVSASQVKPKMGASGWDDAGFLATEDSLVGTTAVLECRRSFGSWETSYSSSEMALDAAAGRTSIFSVKPSINIYTSGVRDRAQDFAVNASKQSQFQNLLNTDPANHKTDYIIWHEFEDEVQANIANPTTKFNFEQWAEAFYVAADKVHALNNPNKRVGFCLRGPWTFDSRSTYYAWRAKWDTIDFTKVDFVAIDPYLRNPGDPDLGTMIEVNNSGTNTGPAGTPTLAQKLLQWGKPVIVGEWGVTETGLSVAVKAQRITAFYNWMKQWNLNHPTVPIQRASYFDISNFANDGSDPNASWKVSGAALTALQNAVTDSRS